MIFVPKRKAFVLILFVFLIGIAGRDILHKNTPVFSQEPTKRIVLDAGHGFPDGGAIGISGTIESTLNLKIALMTQKMLKEKGFTVIMTRTNENSLSKEGETIGNRKKSDMKRRLEIIKDSSADMFISIHMNKFSDSRYKGAQVIFSGNYVQSEKIASHIQQSLNKLKNNDVKRDILRASGNIFLLKNATLPAVIVECGFISNFAEEQKLLTAEYQKEIAGAICTGIENYYKTFKEN